jgi:hypothetical protein
MELPEVGKNSSSSSNKFILPAVVLIVVLGAGAFLFKTFYKGFGLPSITSKEAASSPQDSEYGPYKDFAENFIFAFDNMPAVFQPANKTAISTMMSSDFLKEYGKVFGGDTKLANSLNDTQTSINFQKQLRSEIVTTSGDQAAIRVIGFDIFYDASNHTQNEKDFTYLVNVKKIGENKFVVTKLELE